MSLRNYNAWIRAARKASEKTGGLSLPAARKAYRKMSAKLDRPLKGVDVKNHPIIFKRSIPVRSGGLKAVSKKQVSVKRSATAVLKSRERPRRSISTLREFEDSMDLMLQEDIEYVSTAQYK